MFAKTLAETNGSHPWKRRVLTKQTQFALDLVVLYLAFSFAYLLRFDFAIPVEHLPDAWRQLAFVVLLESAVLFLTGIYSFIWRYIGMGEIKAFVKAAAYSALPLLLLRVGLSEEYQVWRVPFSIIVINTVLAFGGILGSRVLWRSMYERNEKRRKAFYSTNGHKKKKPVLLIGAGRAGVLAAREIKSRGDIELEIKGFIDDDPSKRGSVIHGVAVLGGCQDLPLLVRQLGIDHVVITLAQASRQEFRKILDVCEKIPVRVQIIPGLYEILQGRVKISRIRDVQIEDLLGREEINLEEQNIRQFLSGKTVVVTGAGGSIGSELARQVARFSPSQLLLIDRAEFALFGIEQDLRELFPDLVVVPLVADVGDKMRLRSVFSTHRPEVVFHAAAHKHVPMMEHNSCEAVKNNVIATYSLGEIAGEFGAEAVVLISTDKAVRPTSVMGATKRVAELVIQSLNSKYETRFVAVRFGNVIGSAGSVIPIFKDQIRKGGPVTVTHPEMVRYFMTIPEAAQLVMQAGTMGNGGEIFILDMGEPVRILDLAKDIIALSGLRPFDDIDIVFTGVRPGEKLLEELQTDEEDMTRTRHPKISIGKIVAYSPLQVSWALERLRHFSENNLERELRTFFNELLPEAQLDLGPELMSPAAANLMPHRLSVAASEATVA
jgi:FlaA1/EpsC-like NDP-sugar epimerase